MSNTQKPNTEAQRTLIVCSIISMVIVIVLVISIIIYCICKSRREKKKLNDSIIIEGQNVKNNNNNIQNNQEFHSIPNNSTLGNNTPKTNFSLSEIKEKNLKDEIHNIIHSANSGSSSDGSRKKRKKKSGKKSNRSDKSNDSPSPREDFLGNDDNEISTKKNKKTISEGNEEEK